MQNELLVVLSPFSLHSSQCLYIANYPVINPSTGPSALQRSRLRIGRPQQKGKMSGGHPPLPKAVNCGSKRPLAEPLNSLLLTKFL